jgi:hypothetical protein
MAPDGKIYHHTIRSGIQVSAEWLQMPQSGKFSSASEWKRKADRVHAGYYLTPMRDLDLTRQNKVAPDLSRIRIGSGSGGSGLESVF